MVESLDAVDGSPILDIKLAGSGYLPQGPVREPTWAKELMKKYW